MKNVVIYYAGGRYSEMVLEDCVCKKLCDWFKDDYGESKMEVEVDNKLYKDLKRMGLIYGESKVFTICKRCMNKIKEGVDEDECDD